jgi:hypothetical protein
MIVQEIVEPGDHVHIFVVGQQEALAVRYSLDSSTYLPDLGSLEEAAVAQMKEGALALTRAYGYDINLVEFIVRDGIPLVINPTNPAPDMDINLLKPTHFSWCVNHLTDWAIDLAKNLPRQIPQAEWHGAAR